MWGRAVAAIHTLDLAQQNAPRSSPVGQGEPRRSRAGHEGHGHQNHSRTRPRSAQAAAFGVGRRGIPGAAGRVSVSEYGSQAPSTLLTGRVVRALENWTGPSTLSAGGGLIQRTPGIVVFKTVGVSCLSLQRLGLSVLAQGRGMGGPEVVVFSTGSFTRAAQCAHGASGVSGCRLPGRLLCLASRAICDIKT